MGASIWDKTRIIKLMEIIKFIKYDYSLTPPQTDALLSPISKRFSNFLDKFGTSRTCNVTHRFFPSFKVIGMKSSEFWYIPPKICFYTVAK